VAHEVRITFEPIDRTNPRWIDRSHARRSSSREGSVEGALPELQGHVRIVADCAKIVCHPASEIPASENAVVVSSGVIAKRRAII
jgi:hypothetical protein